MHTIGDCLSSLDAQTWEHREHLIIDGASQDATMEVVKAHHRPPKVLLSEPDQGIYDALNKGLALATGDVVGFLHADDTYASPQALALIAEAFQDPAVSAVYGDLHYVDQHDTRRLIRRWHSKPFAAKDLAWGWMPAHPTLYVRREWYEKIGGFDTSYRIAADYLSILQLFIQPAFNPVYVPHVLVHMRLGGASNRSLKAIVRKSAEDWRALRHCDFNRLGAARALSWKNLRKIGQFRT